MKDFRLLNKISYPKDLRLLSIDELPEVCSELREFIIKELAQNPGHFASSLGTVELTVALHYVFNTPEDRIVWDVGHQAYGHKILTGRREEFHTNRRFGGLRPFPSPAESEYDTFTCGHASNAISAALGMAVATHRQNNGKIKYEKKVVAVLGDGSMSGGLAFEGLNNASSSDNDLLMILNDNDMSIDCPVGGMAQYLLALNTNKTYNNLRFKVAEWLRRIGILTDNRKKGILRLNNALKSLISSQQNIFEGMNIRYFGPFDGHNVKELVRVLRQLKDMRGPKLLHLHTVKGKGYAPAEQSATIWHAPGKFDPATGERASEKEKNKDVKKTPRYQDVFGETLVELAKKNEKIVGITPAMPSGCSLNIMMKQIPERAFDVGIAEGHAVTFAGGMAKDGLIPFCNIYSAFAQRAYDNIIHDVAMMQLPVVFCFDRAGLVGEDGPTHHGVLDIVALRAVPHLIICSPMNESELRNMMYTAQLEREQGDRTFVIRYPRGNGVMLDWHTPFKEIIIGSGRCLKEGDDVAVLTLGPIGNDVEKVISEISDKKSITHYDMRFAKPLDENILQSIADKGIKRIITIEDGARNGGFGSAVLEWYSDRSITIPITRMGLPDEFVEHGTIAELRKVVGLDNESIKRELLR